VEGTFLPGDYCAEHCRVGHVAAVQVGSRRAFAERVADAGPEHDDGGAGGIEQPSQVELLKDGLPVRPGDGPVQRRQRGGLPIAGAGLAVKVIDDGAAPRGDGRQRRR
jgi:hypothetical protein